MDLTGAAVVRAMKVVFDVLWMQSLNELIISGIFSTSFTDR